MQLFLNLNSCWAKTLRKKRLEVIKEPPGRREGVQIRAEAWAPTIRKWSQLMEGTGQGSLGTCRHSGGGCCRFDKFQVHTAASSDKRPVANGLLSPAQCGQHQLVHWTPYGSALLSQPTRQKSWESKLLSGKVILENRWMDGWMDGQTDERDGQMDGWMDGWTGR